MKLFNLPDLGEGLPDAEIREWYVSEGMLIKEGDPLLSVETAKAIVDIPSPYSGKIIKLYGAAEEVIHTGDPLVAFDLEETSNQEESGDSGTVVGEVIVGDRVVDEQSQAVGHAEGRVRATPAVRALARHLGVELSMVTPSGRDGLILSDDVRRVRKILDKVGEMESLRGVRKAMARNMSQAHSEVAQASLMEDADIGGWPSDEDVTARLIAALVAGCKAEPSLNCWFDSHAMGRRLLSDVHVGIAVDSSAGLFVAVLKNAQEKSLDQLRAELKVIKQRISERTIQPDEMRGYSIMLSNFGNISGRYAMPLVLPPTVAILGAGKMRSGVVAHKDGVAATRLLPVSLSFDHRAVTGGEAARFIGAVVRELEKATSVA